MMTRLFAVMSVAALTVGGTTACATKKFVRTSVGDVNDKVDSLGRSVEATEERTRKNEGRISDVDQKAQAAAQAAQQAHSAATAANDAAVSANGVATAAGSRVDSLDKANRRLVYEVVLSEDSGNFTFGKTALPEDAKKQLDSLIGKIKEDPKNVYLEIEGHTDNVGPKEINNKIGLERAEAVKRYMYEQYQVPLHKMNVISYGMEKPVAPNKTKAGRAQNRRVVIKVLA